MSGQAQIAYFRERPTGPITDKTFEVVSEPMPTPKDGELLIATEYLSLDPAMRTWLDEGNKDGSNYMPPIQINAMMTGYGIGKVGIRVAFGVSSLVLEFFGKATTLLDSLT